MASVPPPVRGESGGGSSGGSSGGYSGESGGDGSGDVDLAGGESGGGGEGGGDWSLDHQGCLLGSEYLRCALTSLHLPLLQDPLGIGPLRDTELAVSCAGPWIHLIALKVSNGIIFQLIASYIGMSIGALGRAHSGSVIAWPSARSLPSIIFAVGITSSISVSTVGKPAGGAISTSSSASSKAM